MIPAAEMSRNTLWGFERQYEVTLDGVGCFMITQLTSFGVIRPLHCADYLIPEIWRLPDDEETTPNLRFIAVSLFSHIY